MPRRTIADLVAELRGGVGAVTATLEDNDRPALVWNAAVHHADLHEALGKGAPPEQMWLPVVEAMEPSLGEHAGALAGVPDYEKFRMFFSRRSRAQTAAWDTGLDQETLDGFSIFGPRDDDQPVTWRPTWRQPPAASAGVAHPRRDAVDRQQQRALQGGVVLAAAVAAEELDLEVVEGLEVVLTDLQRRAERGLTVEQGFVAGDRQQSVDGQVVLGPDVVEQRPQRDRERARRSARRCRDRS